MVQGKYIGPLSRRFGERRLIYLGLACLGLGLILTALTPSQPVPWYSRAEIVRELTESTTTSNIAVPLPDDGSLGWFGLGWLLVAMIPTSIGAGVLSPSINSLITKRVGKNDVGGALGVSSSLTSAANAITPLVGGALFQFVGTSAPFLLGGGVLVGLLVFAVSAHPAASGRNAGEVVGDLGNLVSAGARRRRLTCAVTAGIRFRCLRGEFPAGCFRRGRSLPCHCWHPLSST